MHRSNSHKRGACRRPVISAGEEPGNHFPLLFWALHTAGISSSENKSTSYAFRFSLMYCIGLNVISCFGNTAKWNDCCETDEKEWI